MPTHRLIASIGIDMTDLSKATARPWRACGDGKCSCGMIWSKPADAPIVTVAKDGEWGDSWYECVDGKPERQFCAYGAIPDGSQLANVSLIVRAVNSFDALREALERIAAWQMPETGLYWQNDGGTDSDRSMAYSAAYGSNGERDVIRNIARSALAKTSSDE